jgi:hypothetical protein
MKRSATRGRRCNSRSLSGIARGLPPGRPNARPGSFIRVTARLLVSPFFVALATAASAQNPDIAASGFAVSPPAGYVAAPGKSSSPSQVVINLAKPSEPGTSCTASFEALPGFEKFTQDALNRQTDNPDWDRFYRDGLGEFYVVTSVERFDHAEVRGARVGALSRPRAAIAGWIADLPTLIFMFYTPKGLNKVTCVADAAVFGARRVEFEVVARGVTLVR